MIYEIADEKDMLRLGSTVAGQLKAGDVVLLSGELGAGKTTLTKGIAQVFGIDDVVSPTFTLMQIYRVSSADHPTVQKFVHIDTYRLQDQQELVDIGGEDYLGAADSVCIIEWPEKIIGLLKNKKTINIMIVHTATGTRRVTVTSPDS